MGECEPIYEFDKPREACGVFGVYAPGEDVVQLAYLGAEALQHRGQDAAGLMVSSSESGMYGVKDEGLVSEVLTDNVVNGLKDEKAHSAIAHTRYGTSSQAGFDSAQPIYRELVNGRHFALVHNGHIEGLTSDNKSDSETFADMLVEEIRQGEMIERALMRVAAKTDGAYSIVIMTDDRVIGLRDRNGFRPLELGELKNGGGFVIASETAALEQIDADHDRQILPGEVVSVGSHGIWSDMYADPEPKLCAFEYIYFARPSTEINDISVHEARKTMGRLLAEQGVPEADAVVGVPDSGVPAAKGFSEASGIPDVIGLEKNRYISRTFIKDNQLSREKAVGLKLTPLSSEIKGKRLVVVDDSIVRGTTTRALTSMLRHAGAEEVHLKIASPPYKWPCFYGMDTGNPEEFLANQHNYEGMVKELGVDSLDYLSIDNLKRSVGPVAGKICMACLDGDYPTTTPLNKS